MERIEKIQLELIIERCIAETRRFKDTGEGNSSYCYELFRRALADNNQGAFNEMYRVYKPQLEVWARSHSLASELNCSPEILASDVLLRAWKYLGGEQFQEKIASYPQLLVYLRKTLNTVILEEFRKLRRRPSEVPLPPVLTGSESKNPHSDITNVYEIIKRIEKIIPSVDDQIIILCKIYYEMTPAEIIRQYPDKWENPEYISRRIYVLRKRLQNDPVIQEWAGMADSQGNIEASEE